MIAAIVYMGDPGIDLRDDRVKTICYACLCGNVAKDMGITAGTKLTEQAIKKMSFEVVKKISGAVGFRLVTKFGQTGVINLGKAIPLVGGVVGGTFDGVATHTIGRVAKDVFAADGGLSSSNHRRSTATTINIQEPDEVLPLNA